MTKQELLDKLKALDAYNPAQDWAVTQQRTEAKYDQARTT